MIRYFYLFQNPGAGIYCIFSLMLSVVTGWQVISGFVLFFLLLRIEPHTLCIIDKGSFTEPTSPTYDK